VAVEDQLLLGDVGIHAMKRPFHLRFEKGVEFFEEGFQVCEIVVQKIGILEAIDLGEVLVHLEGADGPNA
jgi:hypothetical protein